MWRDRVRAEDGIALVYALLAVVILAGLAVVFVSRAVNEARFTGIGRDREAAVHIAEAGAEAFIAAINDEGDGKTPAGAKDLSERVLTRGTTPSPWPTGAEDYFVYDTTQIDTEAKEIAWVLDLARANPGLVRPTAEGDAFGVRPVLGNEDDAAMVLFGAGFVPSYQAWVNGDPRAQVRIIKMQIARDHIRPEQALLVGGNLKLGGNASIETSTCNPGLPDPDAAKKSCNADVHVNGNLDVTGSSHSIEGRVSTSGTITGSANTVPAGRAFSGEEDEPLPTLEARDFYNRPFAELNVDPGNQQMVRLDLCPGGEIRDMATAPCTGALRWSSSTSSSTTFYGWKYKSTNNTWEARNLEAGYFYVHKADADVTGTAGNTARAVTIIVEGDPANPTKSGSLSLSGNPNMVSAVPDLLFVADRDIKMKGTTGSGNCPTAGCTQRYTGFIWATEQLDVSGTVDIKGAIISADVEDVHPLVTRNTAGVSGTMILDYDPDLVIDISGIVTIQYWNELD